MKTGGCVGVGVDDRYRMWSVVGYAERSIALGENDPGRWINNKSADDGESIENVLRW